MVFFVFHFITAIEFMELITALSYAYFPEVNLPSIKKFTTKFK